MKTWLSVVAVLALVALIVAAIYVVMFRDGHAWVVDMPLAW